MRDEQSINDEHDQNNPLSVMRYHGQIADLFSCREEELHTAIDTVAGNRSNHVTFAINFQLFIPSKSKKVVEHIKETKYHFFLFAVEKKPAVQFI